MPTISEMNSYSCRSMNIFIIATRMPHSRFSPMTENDLSSRETRVSNMSVISRIISGLDRSQISSHSSKLFSLSLNPIRLSSGADDSSMTMRKGNHSMHSSSSGVSVYGSRNSGGNLLSIGHSESISRRKMKSRYSPFSRGKISS